MPYKVIKNGSKYCIHKYPSESARDSGTGGEMVSGSCHTKRSDTIGMMQAIQISEHKKSFDEILTKVRSFVKQLNKM